MKTEIINRALIKLGESPISSTEHYTHGALMDIVYDDVRRSLLSQYVWRFAIKRVALAPVKEETKTFLYKYKYQKPSDCLLTVKINDIYRIKGLRDFVATSGEGYLLEGKYILSNENPLNLIYVADIEDVGCFSELFKMALALKIAATASVRIHQNINLLQIYEQEANAYLLQAIQLNEIAQDTQEIGDNSWISVRGLWNNE